MNNSRILMQSVAEKYLEYSWHCEMVQRAFAERWPQSFANALRLFGPVWSESLLALLAVFDAAGMQKSEIARAIWQAARAWYDTRLFEEVQSDGRAAGL